MESTFHHLVPVPQGWAVKRAEGALPPEDALRLGGAVPSTKTYKAAWAKALHPQDRRRPRRERASSGGRRGEGPKPALL